MRIPWLCRFERFNSSRSSRDGGNVEIGFIDFHLLRRDPALTADLLKLPRPLRLDPVRQRLLGHSKALGCIRNALPDSTIPYASC